MWISPVSHNSNHPSDMITRIAQHNGRPSRKFHLQTHQDVLLFQIMRHAAGIEAAGIRVSHGTVDVLFAGYDENVIADTRIFGFQLDQQTVPQFEGQSHACVMLRCYWRRISAKKNKFSVKNTWSDTTIGFIFLLVLCIEPISLNSNYFIIVIYLQVEKLK